MRIATIVTVLLFLAGLSAAQQPGTLRNLNGTKIYVSEYGKGEPLIVIHGGPGLNHNYFRPHFAGLEKKFRVIYYDQRASGQSATPSPDSISVALSVGDLEALRRDLGIEKLNLLAHSWGAVFATHYAINYPNRVNKLIYSNAAFLSREYDTEAAALLSKRSTPNEQTEMMAIMRKGNLTTADYEKLMQMSFRKTAFDTANIKKLVLNLQPDFAADNKALFSALSKDPAFAANLYDSLKEFSFPVLILHGEADVIPLHTVERMKNNIPGASMVVFKRSGHFPFVEEPAAYAEVVENFLKK